MVPPLDARPHDRQIPYPWPDESCMDHVYFRFLTCGHGRSHRDIAAPDTALSRINQAIQIVSRDCVRA